MPLLDDYIIGLQHIGHVVRDLDATIDAFRSVYGVDETAIRRFPSADDPQDVETKFAFITVSGSEFELIEPVSDRFRELLFDQPSGGAGINHVAWRVSDMDACMGILAGRGIGPGYVTPDGPVCFADRRLVYLDPADTGGLLVELIEHRIGR